MKKIFFLVLLAVVLRIDSPMVYAGTPAASSTEVKSVDFSPEGKGALQVLYRMAPFEGAYGSIRISTMENQIQWECYTNDDTKGFVSIGTKKEPIDLNKLWKYTGQIIAAKAEFNDNYSFSKESKKEFTHRDHTKHKMPEKGCLCLAVEIITEPEEKVEGKEVPAWLREYKGPEK